MKYEQQITQYVDEFLLPLMIAFSGGFFIGILILGL
jgi:hypothetical protein